MIEESTAAINWDSLVECDNEIEYTCDEDKGERQFFTT